MKKLFVFITFVSFFALSSCSKNINLVNSNETDLANRKDVQNQSVIIAHKIVGTWICDDKDDKSSVKIEFGSDKTVKIVKSNDKGENVAADTNQYIFNVIDEKQVEFGYKPNVIGEPMSVSAVMNGNKLELACFLTDKPRNTGFVSPPLLCHYRDFKKVD